MKNSVLITAVMVCCLNLHARANDLLQKRSGLSDSVTLSQDNRDPKEINSSAESRKRRRQDELQR